MGRLFEFCGKLDVLQSPGGIVLTVGVFDGVHLGHQHLLRSIASRSAGLGAGSAVVTFDPHPQSIIAPGTEPPLLTTIEDRARLIREVGIDVVVIVRFTKKVVTMAAEQFVELLSGRMRLTEIWMGPGSAFGRGRQGTPEVLAELGKRDAFSVRVVSPKLDDGMVISSTEIRRLLFLGDVEEAARLLGRQYSLVGKVVSGFERGRELGFPTANLLPPRDLLVPANGIYAARIRVGLREYAGVVNVGMRPTFADGGGRTIEVHILDFVGNLYGRQMRLEFVKRLRDEVRFPSVQQLVEQIRRDVEQARLVLRK